jgi:Flp pilus assembly protein TadD/precorrin-6B methylase 2
MAILSKLLRQMPGRAAAARTASTENRTPREVVAEAEGCIRAGELAKALALVDRATATYPDEPALDLARGAVLFAWGRHHEAYRCLRGAAHHSGDHAQHARLGWTCLSLGRAEEAVDAMRQAIASCATSWEAHFGLGTALRALKRREEAQAAFERALALDPGNADCVSSLMALEMDVRSFDNAERLARRAIELDPGSARRLADLGVVLSNLGRHDEALEAFGRACGFMPAGELSGDDRINHAISVLRSGQTARALAMMEHAIPGCPSAVLQAQYGLALLISGRFREGWRQYEFRWADEALLRGRPNFVKPQWDGQDLRGKSVLLWSEQGFGDFIQFVRYAPSLKALGAQVIVFVRDELRGLAQGVRGIDRILGPGEPYPHFDYYVNLLSLPRVFGTEVETIPDAVPYVEVDARRAAAWHNEIGDDGRLRVGIVWAGSPTHARDRTRSIPIASFASLLSTPGVRFHSLQKGPGAAELREQRGVDVVDLDGKLVDFADTAAAIDRLDLVIGVDTGVVHLAGALGKPVWTLVATPADWRWMEGSDSTPWYPTMRLYRQRRPGEWSDVIERVREALAAAVADRSVLAQPMPRPATGNVKPVGPSASDGKGFSRIAETRLGLVQYFPHDEVGEAIEYYGEHRQLENERLAELVAPGMTALEAGCGIGARTLWLSRRLGPEGHAFLYESDPVAKQVLQQNLEVNRVGNTTLMRNRLRGSSPDPHAASAANDETIDELRLERLDLMLVGEGEPALAILDGAAETLWRCRSRLFVGVRSPQDFDAIAARARDFGYVCARAETPLFNPRNFNNREVDRHPGRIATALIAIPEELAGTTAAGVHRTA